MSTVRKSHSRMLAACRAETQPSWTRAAAARARSPRAGGFPNGAGRDADAESNELALDAPVPPAGILAHQPHHQLTHIVRCRWRPGRRCGYVQRRATSSRCQRSSVAGDTRNDDHARRGSARLSAASSARSAERSCGRAIWRSSTCSWWRRTRSRSPSRAPTASAAQTAPADAAAPSTETRTPCPENDPPRPPTRQAESFTANTYHAGVDSAQRSFRHPRVPVPGRLLIDRSAPASLALAHSAQPQSGRGFAHTERVLAGDTLR